MILTVTLNPSLDEWVALTRLRPGELNRAASASRYPGGKGINVSRVLRELGEGTLALALAGGADGAILSQLLARHRIAHRFVQVAGTTRNNYHIQTARPPSLTQINCPGPRVTAADLRRLDALIRGLRPRPTALICSGSLPPGAPSRAYRRLVALGRRLGLLTVVDSSGPALRQSLSAHPWLIKPNRQEAEELLGRGIRTRRQALHAVRRLTAMGPEIVSLSLGAEGAFLASSRSTEVWWAAAPTVRVDSAVGAGDSLVAGIVLGWARTRSLREALRLGVACGAATAMTPGTELCHRRDVTTLLPRVRVRRAWRPPAPRDG